MASKKQQQARDRMKQSTDHVSTGNTQLSTREQAEVATFENMNSSGIAQVLEKYQGRLAQLLGNEINAGKFVSACVNIIAADPKLQQCTQRSLLGGILNASQMNLSLIPQLGQAYLIPFKNGQLSYKYSRQIKEAEYVIGYAGYVELMMRTNRVASIDIDIIYANDEWDIQLGTDKKIYHRPNLERVDDPEAWELVYGIITTIDGVKKFDWMTKEQVYKHRDFSKGYQYAISNNSDDNPWVQWQEDMIKKTMAIKLRKLVGMSIDDQRHAATDNTIISIDDWSMKHKALRVENLPNIERGDITAEEKPENEGDGTPAKTTESSTQPAQDKSSARSKGGSDTKGGGELKALIDKLEDLRQYSEHLPDEGKAEFEQYYTSDEPATIKATKYWVDTLEAVKGQVNQEK